MSRVVRFLLIAFGVLSCGFVGISAIASANDSLPPAGQQARDTIPTPGEVVGWAIGHQAETPEDARPFYRYLWIPPYMIPSDDRYGWDERHVGAMLSYAINEAAGQTGVIIQPRSIANGWMLAVYLPNYASFTKPSQDGSGRTQLQALTDVWDGIAAEDPYFHIPKELSGIRAAVQSPAIPSEWAELLVTLSSNPSLVYRADWFLEQLLHRHYYRFAQFGKTQQAVYSAIGVDEELAKRLDGDQRIAIFISGVTNGPRRVDRLQGPVGRNGTGAVFQTWDVRDSSVRPNQHPVYQLDQFNPDGGEAIFEKPNGLHGYIVYDAARRLQDAVPIDIARDNIPHPFPVEVVPAISCIRCHGKNGGLQDARNDVRSLLNSGADIAGDLLAVGDDHDIILRLAGLYAGDFDRRIQLGREDYGLAVGRSTFMPHQPQGMGVVETMGLVSAVYERYVFDHVDSVRACLELGIGLADEVTGARQLLDQHIAREFPENAVLLGLKAGIPVRRRDFEQAYPSLMSRVIWDRIRAEAESGQASN